MRCHGCCVVGDGECCFLLLTITVYLCQQEEREGGRRERLLYFLHIIPFHVESKVTSDLTDNKTRKMILDGIQGRIFDTRGEKKEKLLR